MSNHTKEQQAVIEAHRDGKALLVQARAGCGKTHLGVEITKAYPGKRYKFVVFNKKNADEFATKLPRNADGCTAHSFCNKFIGRRINLDKGGNKVFGIIFKDDSYNFKQDTMTKEESMQARENLNSMKQLIGLMKNYFVSPTVEDVLYLIDHYGIIFTLPLDQVCDDAIRFLKKSDSDENQIDFNDMIRFPIIGGKLFPNADCLFVDEAQDNTPIRNLMVKQLYDKGMQIIMVGDRFQAIYGFAGADCDSLDKARDMIDPIELPLTVNFRCGKKIITEAQRIVPDIQAFDKSPDGEVIMANPEIFQKEFSYGDVALSRFNRVIIPACFKFIKQGKKATIQGRDFGEMLIGMVMSFKATSIEEFYDMLDRWQERQSKFCKSESATEAINDKFECLKYFADNSNTVEEICTKIKTIFSDEQGEGLKLSTVHKAKGLEFPRCWILDNKNFMQSRDSKPWQLQQLKNLYYVALTRAKNTLLYVD